MTKTITNYRIWRTIIIAVGVGLIGYVHGEMNVFHGLSLYILGAICIGVGLYLDYAVDYNKLKERLFE